MQHKPRIIRRGFSSPGPSKLPLVLGGIALVLVLGFVALMAVDIPAPQAPIEKQLDAKAFLGSK